MFTNFKSTLRAFCVYANASEFGSRDFATSKISTLLFFPNRTYGTLGSASNFGNF